MLAGTLTFFTTYAAVLADLARKRAFIVRAAPDIDRAGSRDNCDQLVRTCLCAHAAADTFTSILQHQPQSRTDTASAPALIQIAF